MNSDLRHAISSLQGPVLILGASGFVGSGVMRVLHSQRNDVFGTARTSPAWRLTGIPSSQVLTGDLLVETNLKRIVEHVRPKTILNCLAYGAYFFETEPDKIYQTNFTLTARLLRILSSLGIAAYVHAGSSSEYGDNASGPSEAAPPAPNSDYAVSKVASAHLINYYGRKKGVPCANLRLYSVYGPFEDASRLIPTLVREASQRRFPPFVNPDISRDFIFMDDVVEAFALAALNLRADFYGDSFNIGTGKKTTIREVAALAREIFDIPQEPVFGEMPARRWDVTDWFADPERAERYLGWRAKTALDQGLLETMAWYKALPDPAAYVRRTKLHGVDKTYSVSAIVACYKDSQAIPIMHQRLSETLRKLKVDYEIIFVNDGSPDDSESVIRRLSAEDPHVIGVSHSRNFGSQAAFRSGMSLATKNSCVLLDGDLQDPPELIEQLVEKWRAGYDVVYGRRVSREASLMMRVCYKLFYRIFDWFSYISIPHDAGDFSLMDKRVVEWLLTFPERDLFLRGLRAYVGFSQTHVDYIRPERMFGRSTNNLLRNVGWAKKGILSFSNVPLNVLSLFGVVLFSLSVMAGLLQFGMRLAFPELAPKGFTTVILAVLFFGSLNLFGLSLIGEYIAKIFEEVKQRPHFICRNLIQNGEARELLSVLHSERR